MKYYIRVSVLEVPNLIGPEHGMEAASTTIALNNVMAKEVALKVFRLAGALVQQIQRFTSEATISDF